MIGYFNGDSLRRELLANQPCTAWNGHRFQKFDDTHIYCPTCGASKKVGA